MEVDKLRKAFINRLTKDRKGYCAPFFFFNDSDDSDLENARLSYSNTTADMIVHAFDMAVKDIERNGYRSRKWEDFYGR